MAKDSRKSLLAEPVTAISRRESRGGEPVKLPGSENPSSPRAVLLVLVVRVQTWADRSQLNGTRHPSLSADKHCLWPCFIGLAKAKLLQSLEAARTWQIEFHTCLSPRIATEIVAFLVDGQCLVGSAGSRANHRQHQQRSTASSSYACNPSAHCTVTTFMQRVSFRQ
ncbi:uncharacterized protein TrAFT101_003493 [Trichoderma asperellum]|uniref:Uncharacterized protein n=1 Tax=Trichoderma asperellum (strain ATCC 204424 / CBS 433.97 / NBRC 101777) TaxID=1042311 RepID=A0A2T3ZQJ3_TRIA4|nr:hypothetical protein M441DRAFT_230291 [Trichoderma asperellum CBS 433.97]PTB47066.1 hypothetical protein M441DRAFT_230291 [Trichoderma asperellum CBS 433.97]UKZ87721.1 hypothetical protein TrAFT101_003493 [Trichoderma asperellum]